MLNFFLVQYHYSVSIYPYKKSLNLSEILNPATQRAPRSS